VILLIAVLIVATSVGVVAVARSSVVSRGATDKQVAMSAASSGADLFYAALNSAGNGAFPSATTGAGAACFNGSSQPQVCVDQYPTTLDDSTGAAVTSSSWYTMSSSGLVNCATAPQAITTTCLNFTDVLAPLSSATKGAYTAGSAFEINLQVDAKSNCRVGSWTGSTQTGCALSRVEQRLTPRQFTNYLEFDGSELLDPWLFAQSGGSYPNWYSSCTSSGTLLGDADLANNTTTASGASASVQDTCVVPAYLGPSSYTQVTGSPLGDTTNGPLATNDQTFFTCGTSGNFPSFNGSVQSTNTSSAHPGVVQAYPVPQASSVGTCQSGGSYNTQTVAASPLPQAVSSLASDAASQDVYTPGGGAEEITLAGTSTSSQNYISQLWGTSSTTTNPWPATGVIYVNGNAYVSGTSCSGVTIAASQNIYIVDNVTNGRLLGTAGCNGSVGLVAGGSVVVIPALVGQTCPTTLAAGACSGAATANQIECWVPPNNDGNCQTIQAAVMALGSASGGTINPLTGSLSLPSPSGGACPYSATLLSPYQPNGYWPLSNYSGGGSSLTTPDVSGNSNTGLIQGSPSTWGARTTPQPLACDGTQTVYYAAATGTNTQFIATTNPVSSDQQGSVAVWFKSSAGGSGTLAALDSPSIGFPSSWEAAMYIGTDGKVVASAFNGTTVNSVETSTAYNTGGATSVWHMAVLTFCMAGDPNCSQGISLSVDGALVGTSTTSPAAITGSYYWRFGELGANESAASCGWPDLGTNGGAPADCTQPLTNVGLANIAGFSSVLEPLDIQTLWNAGNAAPDTLGGGMSFYEQGWNADTPPSQGGGSGSSTFTSNGTFTVPTGVGSVSVTVIGATGAAGALATGGTTGTAGAGGLAGDVTGTISGLAPGQTLGVDVANGSSGYTSGGAAGAGGNVGVNRSGAGGAGGGSSAICVTTCSGGALLALGAGGGGGGGADFVSDAGGTGGNAMAAGTQGNPNNGANTGGGAATYSANGAAGTVLGGAGQAGQAGTTTSGGAAGAGNNGGSGAGGGGGGYYGAGGGGGGYYHVGGGGARTETGGGGGGGGDYPQTTAVSGGVTMTTSSATTTSGTPEVLISYSSPKTCVVQSGYTVTTCALVFQGSVTEQFRGAFGDYIPSATSGGAVQTGITKDFSYDPALLSQQPPDELQPYSGAWQRVSTTYTGQLES
jgi:hypothetical protein